MPTSDHNGEWCKPERVELHWINKGGESLGISIPSGVEARPGWVALYSGKWVEVFPGGAEYARPN